MACANKLEAIKYHSKSPILSPMAQFPLPPAPHLKPFFHTNTAIHHTWHFGQHTPASHSPTDPLLSNIWPVRGPLLTEINNFLDHLQHLSHNLNQTFATLLTISLEIHQQSSPCPMPSRKPLCHYSSIVQKIILPMLHAPSIPPYHFSYIPHPLLLAWHPPFSHFHKLHLCQQVWLPSWLLSIHPPTQQATKFFPLVPVS